MLFLKFWRSSLRVPRADQLARLGLKIDCKTTDIEFKRQNVVYTTCRAVPALLPVRLVASVIGLA